MTTIAYSYTRLSTEKQLKGHGEERQRKAIEQACLEHGWTLSEQTFSDLGVSAWKGLNRQSGALSEFLTLARNGSIEAGSVLIVENGDRLSREGVQKALRLLLELLDLGVHVYTLSDNKLYTDDGQNAMLDLMQWMMVAQRAYEESAMKSVRILAVKDKAKELMRQGVIVTRKCPAWLHVSADKSHFELIDERVKVVQMVFKLYSEGYSTKPIALKLNEQGIPYWGSSKTWTYITVRNLLKNRAVIGELQPLKRLNGKDVPDGEVIKDYYPSIISKELYARCLTLRTSKATSSGRLSNNAMANLFRGLLKCQCGSGMALNSSIVKGKRYSSLRCSQLRSADCKSKNWHYGNVESIVMIALHNIDWELNSTQDSAQSIRDLEQRIELTKAELVDVQKMAESAEEALLLAPSSARLAKRLAECETREAELERLVESLNQELTTEKAKSLVRENELETIQQVLEDVANDDGARFKANALLNRKLKSITFSQADSYYTQQLTEFSNTPMHGVITIELNNGKLIEIEVCEGYRSSFVREDDGSFTEIELDINRYQRRVS
ncbi:recombinase family protein [Vibrio hepatarius]|uniref:recombinase family protein n=1 Tax=Vibrio hepatarius TaxID=171383 RepID=UPI0006A97FD5|nr:recombinase family protein [Vibrio hepatarius]